MMNRTVGSGPSYRAVSLGTLFTPQEALKMKLVDKLVQPNQVLTAAEEEIKRWIQIPS